MGRHQRDNTKNNKRYMPYHIEKGSETITDPEKIANCFNDYFSEVATGLLKKKFEAFLKCRVEQ